VLPLVDGSWIEEGVVEKYNISTQNYKEEMEYL
jgi:hypothetical protein